MIVVKTFEENETVPLYFAPKLEMLICDGLKGEIILRRHRYEVKQKDVIVVPPNIIYSTSIKKMTEKCIV